MEISDLELTGPCAQSLTVNNLYTNKLIGGMDGIYGFGKTVTVYNALS